MQIKYRGYEITVEREDSLGGWSMLYYSISDNAGLTFVDGCTEDESSIEQFVEYMKARVDTELADDNPWNDVMEVIVKADG